MRITMNEVHAAKIVYEHSSSAGAVHIPSNWDIVRLGELFEFKNGLNKAKHFFGSGTPIVNYMDVFEKPGLNVADISGRVTLSPDEIKNFEVRRGDVFFTRTSETVEDIGIASVMLEDACDTVFSGFVLRARPISDRLDDRYKKYCFASNLVRSQIVSKATYTTRALTNGRLLSSIKLVIPPLPEQRAIAAALSDVDGLLDSLATLIAKKQAVKEAAMQQLLTGRTRLPGFGGEWEWHTTKLGEFAPLTYGESLPIHKRNSSGSIPVFGSNGLVDFHDTALTSGPTVIVGRKGSIGKVHFSPGPCWPIDTTFFVTGKDKYSMEFKYYMLGTLGLDNMNTDSAVPGLNRNLAHSQELRVPSMPEQHTIAAVLSDMDDEISALNRWREKTEAVKRGMMQELLTGRVRLVEAN